jgi:hypothetical protein
MFIDAFDQDWLDELDARAERIAPSDRLYLLLDGAFVPGLHKMLARDRKVSLFASLPGCTEQALDASPFLTPFDNADKTLRSLLRRCNRWPMVSVIETPESLEQLAARLSAWCVVEADGQRFNFRFPDTRRLPAIFSTLNPKQRSLLAGPAQRWSYIGRDGLWCELQVEGSGAEIVGEPVLDEQQFAILVSDSEADELMVLLRDRGHEVLRHPSRSHALLSNALHAARLAELTNDELLGWCEWFWQEDQLREDSALAAMLQAWRRTSL